MIATIFVVTALICAAYSALYAKFRVPLFLGYAVWFGLAALWFVGRAT